MEVKTLNPSQVMLVQSFSTFDTKEDTAELMEVLSVFAQTHMDRSNRQVLNIDEDLYSGDEDMKRIIHRLLSAASDAKLRQDMNVEDEYFAAIENRDTAIMQRDQKIAEQDAQIAEQELLLNKTIQMLMSAGLNIETIAMNMNIKKDEVLRIAKLS